jgi:mono/diheme cytochrome c family protein
MLTKLSGMCAAVLLLGISQAGTAADVEAGKAKMDKVCAECHQLSDWKGKTEAQMRDQIAAVVAGKAKHPKKPQLSDEDVANIAAYVASGTP